MAIGDNLRLARAQTAQTTIQNIKSQEALADRLAKIGVSRRREAVSQQELQAEQAFAESRGEIATAASQFSTFQEFQTAEPELARQSAEQNINLGRFFRKAERELTTKQELTAEAIETINARTDLSTEEKLVEIGKLGKGPEAPSTRIADVKFERGRIFQKELDEDAQLDALKTFEQLGFAGSTEQAFQEVGDEIRAADLDFEQGMDIVSTLTDVYFDAINKGFAPESVARAIATSAINSIISKSIVEGDTLTREQIIPLARLVISKIQEGGR